MLASWSDYIRRKGKSVHIGLEGALNGEAKVVSLDLGEGAELSLAVGKVETGDLLIEDLGEDGDANLELAGLGELNVLLAPGSVAGLVEHDLGQDLVGERAGHDERGVASGTAKVDQTTLGEENDVAAVGHEEAVNLGLDVLDGRSVGLEPGDVDLNVEVTDVCKTPSELCIKVEGRRKTYCRRWRR